MHYGQRYSLLSLEVKLIPLTYIYAAAMVQKHLIVINHSYDYKV